MARTRRPSSCLKLRMRLPSSCQRLHMPACCCGSTLQPIRRLWLPLQVLPHAQACRQSLSEPIKPHLQPVDRVLHWEVLHWDEEHAQINLHPSIHTLLSYVWQGCTACCSFMSRCVPLGLCGTARMSCTPGMSHAHMHGLPPHTHMHCSVMIMPRCLLKLQINVIAYLISQVHNACNTGQPACGGWSSGA